MKKANKSKASTLRENANDLLDTSVLLSGGLKIELPLSENEVHKLLHELEVHKVELQLQNDELQCAINNEKIASSKYINLYDFSPSGYFTLSKFGNITELNLTGSKILGKERSKLINSKMCFFVTIESKSIFNQFLDKIFQSQKQESCEVTLLNKNGLPNNVLLTGIITGNHEFCNLTMVDINELKSLEQQLQIHQHMDSLGILVGGISHDFNNILGAVIGNLELLSLYNDNFTEKQKKYLNNVITSTNRAIELTKQFQTLSTSSPGNETSIDIYDIAKEVFGLISETTDRLIRKEIKFNKNEFFVSANPVELHQVLLNLATNSISAMEERDVTKNDCIQITAENYQVKAADRIALTEGEYVHISFKDTGGGMTDDVLKNAFVPMFTTKDKGNKRGQGLGLAMVYNIITKHNNGFVEIYNEKSEGTTFHIYLPKDQSKKITEVDKNVITKRGVETVLIVDDDKMITSMAEAILNDVGYMVLIANDGIEALNIYAKEKDSISVIILDLNMPKMSGKQVLEELLKITPEVKVIISSGFGVDLSQQGALSKAKGNLGKPYGIADLSRIVRNVIDMDDLSVEA